MENILITFYTGNAINDNNNSWEQKNLSNPIFNPDPQNLSRSHSMPYRYKDSNYENSNIFQTTGNMMISSPDPYRIQMLEERVRELELKSKFNNLKYPNSFEPNVLSNQTNSAKNVPLYLSINEPQYLYERYFNLRPLQEFNNFRMNLKKKNPYRKGVKRNKNEKSNNDENMYLIAESFNDLKNELQKKIIVFERKHNEEFNDLREIILNRNNFNNEIEENTEYNETNTNKSPSYKSEFNNNLENNISQKVSSSSKITSRMISFNDEDEIKSKDRVHSINHLDKNDNIPQNEQQNNLQNNTHKTNKSSFSKKKNKKNKNEYSENKSNSIRTFNINSENNSKLNNSNEENENEEQSSGYMFSYHDKEEEKSKNRKHGLFFNKNRRRDIPINYIGDNMEPYQINKMPPIEGKEKKIYKKENKSPNDDPSINSKILSFHDKEDENSNDREHNIIFNNIRNRNPILIRNENMMNNINNNNGPIENNNQEDGFLMYEGEENQNQF